MQGDYYLVAIEELLARGSPVVGRSQPFAARKGDAQRSWTVVEFFLLRWKALSGNTAEAILERLLGALKKVAQPATPIPLDFFDKTVARENLAYCIMKKSDELRMRLKHMLDSFISDVENGSPL